MDAPLILTNTQFVFLVAWCVFVLLAGWCMTFFIIRKTPGQVETALKDGLLPKLLTIILVLLATTILALTGKMTEATAAIFSGVVGYVLGTTNTPRRADTNKDRKPNKAIESDEE